MHAFWVAPNSRMHVSAELCRRPLCTAAGLLGDHAFILTPRSRCNNRIQEATEIMEQTGMVCAALILMLDQNREYAGRTVQLLFKSIDQQCGHLDVV